MNLLALLASKIYRFLKVRKGQDITLNDKTVTVTIVNIRYKSLLLFENSDFL